MMMATYQASDAAVYTVRGTLIGDMWGNHVYIDEAPSQVSNTANIWVVMRILSDVPSGYRGDRDDRRILLRVNCVSEDKDLAWTAAAKMYSLVNESGSQDRASVSIGTHSEWNFLTVSGGRFFHLLPNKDAGTRFFEAGYEFTLMMEAKNGYA